MRRKTATFLAPRPVPETAYALPLDRAVVVREGRDLTIVTLSKGVQDCLACVEEQLVPGGIKPEIIDLVALVPFDAATVAASVAKTGRLLVVDEDYRSYGVSAEVLARVVEALGTAAVRAYGRVCVPDVPIPAARTLEEAVLPTEGKIAAAARSLVARR